MTIEVEAPDGSIVEFPDGTDHAVMAKAMAGRFAAPTGAPAAPVTQPPVNAPSWGLQDQIINGMTFGALPNIRAAGGAVGRSVAGLFNGSDKSIGQNYDDVLAEQQGARRAHRAESPVASVIEDAAGGVLTGGTAAKAGATLVGRMANKGLENLLPRVAAGAGEGGIYGALSGFLGGEGGAENRARGAVENIPLGAAVGGASIPVADYLVGPIMRGVSNIYRGIRDPAAQGQRLTVEAIMRDKQTPGMLADARDAAVAAGQPEYLPVDAAGRNSQKLVKAAGRTPGEFRNEATHTLDARQAGQTDRIKGFVNEASGNTGPNAFQTEQQLLASRRAAAQPAYDAAYAVPLPDDPFYANLLKKPIIQQAVKNIEAAAANSVDPKLTPESIYKTPVVPGPGTQGDGVRMPSTQGWDYIKRYLDKAVDSAFTGTADEKALAPTLRVLRDTLRERLAADNPAYAKALQQFTDDTTSLKALETGRNLGRSPSDATRAEFDAIPSERAAPQAPPAQGTDIVPFTGDETAAAAMANSDQQLARRGAASEIGARLDSHRGGQDSTLLFDNNNTRGTLDRAAVSPEARAVLGDAGLPAVRSGRLGREADMAATRRMMAGGSDTAENLGEIPSSDVIYGAGQAVSGHPFRALSAFGQALSRSARGLNEQSAAEIGRFLFNPDTGPLRGLGEMFINAQRAASAPSFVSPLTSAVTEAPRQRPQRGPR